MNKQTQSTQLQLASGATGRHPSAGRRTILLAAALLAALGLSSSARADRVTHDVSAGNVIVSNNVAAGTLPTDAGTELYVPVAVNGFDIINNHNISDHKIKIGETEADDSTNGVLISAVSENLRNNRGSNMTHTVSMSIVNSSLSYEVASQSVPLNGTASIEDNVNFASAYFPFATWLGGYAFNLANDGAPMTNFIGSKQIVLGTHFFDSKATNGANGVAYLDLRSLGIDSRRDGVLLVNHARNEANYALSRVNNDDDEMDGTWTIYTHDNRVNGRAYEQDPVAFVFVPKKNTSVVSGMFMGDGAIAIYSGNAPEFTVAWRPDIANGTYELKIPGRSPDDGVLVISPAGGDPFNGDNIVTYQANPARDGWLIQSRDLPNAGLQSIPDNEPVCSFVFVPAEKPGITVTPNKNLQTTENGGSADFTVTLNGYPKPTADVTVTLTCSDPSEGTLSATTLTFTPADWNVAKTVTLTGVDDAIADGTQPYTVNLSATSSADPKFNGLMPGSVGAINIDNEAGISVSASKVITTEAGGTDTFNVWLNTAPTADVTLTLSSSDTTEATVSPASLTFTPDNYSTPQTVTVTGVDDAEQDGPATYFVVTATATSSDPVYNGFDTLDVAGENQDNDVAGVIVPADKVVVSEPNTSANVALRLASKPTANVTINLTSSDLSEATVTPSVTFTPANWNTPQNVTVTAVDDNVNDGTVEFSIVTSITTSDPVYAALNPDDLVVNTLDNEAVLSLSSSNLVYGAGQPAMGVDGSATITDPDTTSYNGGNLTVSITGGTSTDRLALRNDGTGAGQIGVSGSTVSYGGSNIGTVSGGTGTTPLVVTFNTAAATPEAAQALVRAVTYQNLNTSAPQPERSIVFALADGHGGVTTVAKAVNIRLLRVYSFQQDADAGFGPYTGAADTQIVWDQPSGLFPAGSSAAGLWIDWNENDLLPNHPDQSQALLRFTNIFGTGPGQIPPGAKIVSAELILNVADSGHGARFNRMLTDWDADYTTYSTYGDGIQLDDVEAVSGTNTFLGDEAHSTTLGGGLRKLGVTADVQAWVDGANNYGWVLSPWEGGANGTAFSPCEFTNITLRPKLVVSWVPAGTSVATFQQGVNGYTGSADTMVRLAGPDTSFATSTTLAPDSAVNANPAVNPQQVLIRFDNIIGTAAGQVPPGSIIHAAVLELTSISSDSQGNGGIFYPMLRSWADTDTWNTLDNGISTDGVEAAATPTTTVPAEGMGVWGGAQSMRHTVDLTSDVQAWANGTRPNYGWAILPWPNGSNGWGFNSADEARAATHPQLRVYFEQGVLLMKPVYNGSSVQVSFTGVIGRTYTVQRTGSLGGGWSNIGSAVVQPDGKATYTDNAPLANGAFYRIAYP